MEGWGRRPAGGLGRCRQAALCDRYRARHAAQSACVGQTVKGQRLAQVHACTAPSTHLNHIALRDAPRGVAVKELKGGAQLGLRQVLLLQAGCSGGDMQNR